MGFEQFDTILAFSAVMLTLSLLVTIFVQMAIAATNLRGRGLADGLERLLKQLDPSLNLVTIAGPLTEAVLKHPAVAHLGFARAVAIRKEELVRVLEDLATRKDAGLTHAQQQQLAGAIKAMAPGVPAGDVKRATAATDALLKAFPGVDRAVRQAVADALQAKGKLQTEIEAWFDSVMDRTTERFVLHTRLITAAVAAGLCFGLQIDSLAILAQLTSNKEARSQVLASAGPLLKEAEALVGDPKPIASEALRVTLRELGGKGDMQQTLSAGLATRAEGRQWLQKNIPGDQRDKALQIYEERFDQRAQARLTELSDAFGRVRTIASESSLQIIPWPSPPWSGKHFLGVVISALLLGLGAPFWFNVLKQLSTLRPALARKAEEKTA